MIQYFCLNSEYHLRIYSRAVPVGAGAVLDFLGTFAIMYLTRQPIGRCKLPDPANITVYKVSRPIRPRYRAAYLCFKFRIATTSRANVSKICISSYVLISISPFHKTGSGTSTPLGCLGKYIILLWMPQSCPGRGFYSSV